jgi:hypothetical protein
LTFDRHALSFFGLERIRQQQGHAALGDDLGCIEVGMVAVAAALADKLGL